MHLQPACKTRLPAEALNRAQEPSETDDEQAAARDASDASPLDTSAAAKGPAAFAPWGYVATVALLAIGALLVVLGRVRASRKHRGTRLSEER